MRTAAATTNERTGTCNTVPSEPVLSTLTVPHAIMYNTLFTKVPISHSVVSPGITLPGMPLNHRGPHSWGPAQIANKEKMQKATSDEASSHRRIGKTVEWGTKMRPRTQPKSHAISVNTSTPPTDFPFSGVEHCLSTITIERSATEHGAAPPRLVLSNSEATCDRAGKKIAKKDEHQEH